MLVMLNSFQHPFLVLRGGRGKGLAAPLRAHHGFGHGCTIGAETGSA
jgi:hypothetical protein